VHEQGFGSSPRLRVVCDNAAAACGLAVCHARPRLAQRAATRILVHASSPYPSSPSPASPYTTIIDGSESVDRRWRQVRRHFVGRANCWRQAAVAQAATTCCSVGQHFTWHPMCKAERRARADPRVTAPGRLMRTPGPKSRRNVDGVHQQVCRDRRRCSKAFNLQGTAKRSA
jgi:hypothetical protein